jgi:hypothetical protein
MSVCAPDLIELGAVLAAVKDAGRRFAMAATRASLTAAARGVA